LFSREERSKVVEMLGSPSRTSCCWRWAELDPEVKTKWEAKGKEAKAEYDEVKANYSPSEEFLAAATAHNKEQQAKVMMAGDKAREMSGDMIKTVDKMAPYFSHLLNSWTKVATTWPDLTAQEEVQTEVWQ
jgi:hypothetical protein